MLRICLIVTHLLLLPIHSWSFGSRCSNGRTGSSSYARKRIRTTISDVESTPPSLLSSSPVSNNASSLQMGLSQLKPFLQIAVNKINGFYHYSLPPSLSLIIISFLLAGPFFPKWRKSEEWIIDSFWFNTAQLWRISCVLIHISWFL